MPPHHQSEPPPAAGRPDFASFYTSEWPGVLGLVRAITGSRWVAEDMAQDAFVKAYRRWDEVAGYDRPDAWIRTVAVNLARSRFRRAAAELRALRRLVGMSVTAVAEMRPPAERFWDEVRRLPRRQRDVVALHYVEDMSVRDIATTLGVAESTVKTSLQKGRQTLARRLDEEVTS